MPSKTTSGTIFQLIIGEMFDKEREDVLKHLCRAFSHTWAEENDNEEDIRKVPELHSSEEVHRYYVNSYYCCARDIRTDDNTYLGSNPREVSVPPWADNFAPLLDSIARVERRRDDVALSYMKYMAR